MEHEKCIAAVALGMMGKGKPKTLTDEQREKKRELMVRLNLERGKKLAEKRRLKEELEKAVGVRAKAGLFTEIQAGE